MAEEAEHTGRTWLRHWNAVAGRVFLLDTRSLAAFRIGLGAILVVDALLRLRDLTAHYTDAGVLPRDAWVGLYTSGNSFGNDWWWSLHLANGTAAWAALLLLAMAACGVLLMLGCRTRWAALAGWVLVVSLHRRMPAVLNGGDVLLRCLLFWSLFLPLGAAVSWDARRVVRSQKNAAATGAAAAALILQIVFMYLSSALLKDHPAWIRDHTAVYYALNLDMFSTAFGTWLLRFPSLLAGLSFGTWVLELVGAILIVSPVFTKWIRLSLVPAFVAMHLGFAATLHLGLFPWICIAAWLALLPSLFWERILGLGDRPDLYVEECLWRGSRIAAAAVIALIVYVGLWNLRELDFERWERVLPITANGPARLLGLDQYWGMFAPHPPKEEGWFVMRGTLWNGEKVNLWSPGEELPWSKPASVAEIYRSQRWRKYLDNLSKEANRDHRPYFCRWLRRRWERTIRQDDQARKLRVVDLYYVTEATPAPGSEVPVANWPQSRIWTERFDGLPALGNGTGSR